MGQKKNCCMLLAFIAGIHLSCFNIHSAYAQQTIFNVPSAEVTPEGVLFLQHESQFRPYPKQFWLSTHYSALGIGQGTELNVTLFDLNAPFTRSLDLGVGFKNVHPILVKRFPTLEFKTILGSLVVPSLQGKGVGNWTYVAMSGRLPKIKTRLTAGATYGTEHIFGKTMVGFIGGVEQPLTKRFSAIMDWYSGDSSLGLLIPGVGIQATDTVQIFAGYQIPNPSNKLIPSGFVIEIAKFIR